MGSDCSQPQESRSQARRRSPGYVIVDRNSCGLIMEKAQRVHLKSVEVEVQVKGYVATVTSTLQYVNEEELPVEALFVFPLPAEAALCHFSTKIADQELVAEVHEKQKAQEMYDDALSSGQQTFFWGETEESPGVFRLAVGNLPPKESAAVTLIYVTELAVQVDDGLRFCLPAVLNPRYAPSNIVACASKVPYTLSLGVHITSSIPVSRVESSCSLEPLIYLNTAQTQAKVSLSPGHKFDRDVEILLYYQDAHQPTAIVEAGLSNAKPGSLMGDSLVMLSLFPEFPAEVVSSFGKRGEFILVMDQSGSMAGSLMRSAKETLLLLLKSLPLGCYFNIYGFGSDFKSFFPKSVEYTQKTVELAVKKVEAMKADRVGTDILRPLEHIYKRDHLPDQPKQVFLFTDGDVPNTKEILDLVRTHSRSHRCFTFGIGQFAGTALITGMAREGRGFAQFITSNDRLQLKVMQSLSFALQPSVVDISVKWTLPEGVSITALSPPLNVLFQGQRALLYAQLTGESSENDEGTVTVHYSLEGQPVTNQFTFCLKAAEDSGLGFHRLAARSLIRSLEMEVKEMKDESLREKVVELSVQTGVSSSFTAFLTVHKGSGQPVKGPLVRDAIPASYLEYDEEYDSHPRHQGKPHELFIPSRYHSPECEYSIRASASPHRSAQKDPYLDLVSLQKAAGNWDLEAKLFDVVGKTEEELAKQKPPQVDSAMWATVLALIWLYGFRTAEQEEWKFIAMKATSWIRSQKVGNLSECVQAGNAVLGCQVEEECMTYICPRHCHYYH
ncbi:von Willebrand factor A domain-containing protein 5A-like [Colossoma macropomum]|uniref:von Willebrand factor A domain-containing protein 5A-like n=1 Tax=Colossoma macropomum TaxID=42526 RepID=UPI00186495D7|nr:von Willebrand factor A domain-containing protein 5A-like [Colossoma macropomum]